MWETIAPSPASQVDVDAVVEPRLVERRRARAHDLRARRAADLAGVRDLHASRRTRAGSMSARGVVPTPHGPIRVSWQLVGGKLALQVTAPPGTVWENASSRRDATPVRGDGNAWEHSRARRSRSRASGGLNVAFRGGDSTPDRRAGPRERRGARR